MHRYFKTQVVMCWGGCLACCNSLAQTDPYVKYRPLRNAAKSEKSIKLFHVPSCSQVTPIQMCRNMPLSQNPWCREWPRLPSSTSWNQLPPLLHSTEALLQSEAK